MVMDDDWLKAALSRCPLQIFPKAQDQGEARVLLQPRRSFLRSRGMRLSTGTKKHRSKSLVLWQARAEGELPGMRSPVALSLDLCPAGGVLTVIVVVASVCPA